MERKTVLIADDDPELVDSLTVRAQEFGLTVRTAANGAEVLNLISEELPDLLILAINMTAADGLSVYKTLMIDPSFAPFPVILFSGGSDPKTLRHCESLGAHYVVKTADAWEKLQPLIREILFGERLSMGSPMLPAAASWPPRILVIDDDFRFLQALKIRLEVFGVEVLTATSGMHGFWKALKSNPDAIVTDYVMPHTNGEGLLIRLKSNALLKHIPVIVVTGKTNGAYENHDLENDMLNHRGAVAFLTKPLDFHALLDALERYVDLRTVRADWRGTRAVRIG